MIMKRSICMIQRRKKFLIKFHINQHAFIQEFYNNEKDTVLLASLEGKLIKYRYDSKYKDAEQNVNNIFQINKFNNYFANPPLITKILLTDNDLFVGLINGYLLNLSPKNLKKKKMKQLHTLSIYDL